RELPAVQLDDFTGDGEAEAGALPRRLGGEERLRGPHRLLLADAPAVVGHGEDDAAVPAASHPGLDVAARRAGVAGVEQQVDHRLLEEGDVAVDGGELR